MPESQPTIAIVGGGIGGLSTAIGLLSHSIPVTIYESAPAFAEIGAGMGLGPNAVHAMKMIDPRMYSGFQKCATRNAWQTKENHWFTFRRGDAEGKKGGGQGGKEEEEEGGRGAEVTGIKICDVWCEGGLASVHRATFLDELIALVPKEIAQFGKRLRDIDDNGDHVVLHFHDGTSARHSAVIGCDGIKSRTRQILLGADHPAANPQFTGKFVYRGLIPMEPAAKLMGDELAYNCQTYLGRGGHILTYPIENGKTINAVAFGTKEDGKWDETDWVKPVEKSVMHKHFDGWVTATHEIFSLMKSADLWAMFDHPSTPTYFKNRVCILGDAAHATTPYQGAGAGMAIEDALIMSSVMALVISAEEIPRAFQVFDTIQRPRSQKVVTTSREAGLLYHMQLPNVGDDLELIKHQLGTRMKWIWDADLEARVTEAEMLFSKQALL